MSTEETEFTFTDRVPESGNPEPTPEYTCIVCGTGIAYGGRGRKPKYCDEHKPNRSSKNVTSRGSTVVVDRAISEIATLYVMGGQALKFVNPVAGELVYENADKLGESYRLLLETNARFRKLFQKMESEAAILPIVAVHTELVISIIAQMRITNELKDMAGDVNANHDE